MSNIEFASSDQPIEYGGFGGGIVLVEDKASKGRFLDLPAATKGMRQPALQGWAATWGQPFQGKMGVGIFSENAFAETLASKATVRFQLEHDDNEVIATTDDRLELHSDEKGLGFRLRLADNGLGEMVKSRMLDAVSVGMSYKESDTRVFQIDGRPVTLIKKAELREISLVRRGAVKTAFAQLVDLANASPLAIEMKSSFAYESAASRVAWALQDAFAK